MNDEDEDEDKDRWKYILGFYVVAIILIILMVRDLSITSTEKNTRVYEVWKKLDPKNERFTREEFNTLSSAGLLYMVSKTENIEDKKNYTYEQTERKDLNDKREGTRDSSWSKEIKIEIPY